MLTPTDVDLKKDDRADRFGFALLQPDLKSRSVHPKKLVKNRKKKTVTAKVHSLKRRILTDGVVPRMFGMR